MSTPPATRTALSQEILARAYTYSAGQQQAQAEMVAAAILVWASIDMKNPVGSWVAGIGRRIYVLLSLLQELAANDAYRYVRDVQVLQGLDPGGPRPNPRNFAGIASDGRDLESLLVGAVVRLRAAQDQGKSDGEARRAGEMWLRMILATQASDQARAAESVSIAASEPTRDGRKTTVGWIRLLTPPSCGRCVVLAGKFYRWNAGFQRHPMCDCRHLPVTVAAAEGLLTDPYVYFNALSREDQDRLFGKGPAQAIRDGADINQVVNASRKGSMFTADGGRRYTREGTTRRGLAGKRAGKVLRPTPYQIYRDADGDRAKALAALYRFGYLLSPPTDS